MAQDIKKSREEAYASLQEIKKMLEIIKWYYDKIDNDSSDEEKAWIYQRINQKYDELFWVEWKEGKIKELNNFFSATIDDEDSYKKQIEDFFKWTEDTEDFETRKENFSRLEKAIFWENIGTPEELPWLDKRLEKLFEDNEIKYNHFYDKINKELTAWTTSVALAQVFADRVKAYNNERALWSTFFIIWWIILISKLIGDFKETTDWVMVSLNFLQHLPVFLLVAWIWFFVSSRQAESRKLEEAYRHKETMARAYFWYKDTIKELDSKDDSELTKKHMENLLDAMKDDSSIFLSHNGEKHPLYDVFTKFLDKSWWKISVGNISVETK